MIRRVHRGELRTAICVDKRSDGNVQIYMGRTWSAEDVTQKAAHKSPLCVQGMQSYS